jgi:aminoacrylate hydrolase
MGDIKAPTLVIVAEDDMVTPRHLSDQLEEGITGAERVTLPTGGHFVIHILVEEYNRAVNDFLQRNPL